MATWKSLPAAESAPVGVLSALQPHHPLQAGHSARRTLFADHALMLARGTAFLESFLLQLSRSFLTWPFLGQLPGSV